jgi:hypothetical protein
MADMADLADVANMAVTARDVTRCPRCGMIAGGTAAALGALYDEVARLRRIAEQEAAAREAELLREIRLLQETVARLRGKIVTLQRLDILITRPTMIRHFLTKGAGVCLSTAISTREVAWSGPHLQT